MTKISPLIAGADPDRRLDALFVNAPLRDYDLRPRVNDFTLPVLGMAYIATYARQGGFNVGVLDAEAHGLGLATTGRIANDSGPRWVGLNLLAPTYEMSAAIAAQLDEGILLMLGGHQAKAMPVDILKDPRMRNCAALVLGEAETRVLELLRDTEQRRELPLVMWLDRSTKMPAAVARIDNALTIISARVDVVTRAALVAGPATVPLRRHRSHRRDQNPALQIQINVFDNRLLDTEEGSPYS